MSDPAYGRDHQRRRLDAVAAAYNTPCPRCGQLMLRGQRLDYGHSVDKVIDSQGKADRVEHADYSDCRVGGNRSAGGKLGVQRRRFAPSRKW